MQQEEYWWIPQNLTEGCTSSCRASLDSWVSSVQAACSGQTLRWEGRLVAPDTLPQMYRHTFTLACIPGGASGWCLVDSQEWVGSDMLRNDEHMCATGHVEYDHDLCFTKDFDPFAVEPGDVRLANLYDRSMVCSECFLQILHRRLLNPGLADGDWTDYLIAQHSDLQTYCSTNMPLTATRTSTAVPPVTGTATLTTSGPAAFTTCAGALVTPPSEPGVTCHMLSEQYNVTTGDLTVLTNDWDCQFTESVCIPPPCQIMMIGWMETCETLARKVSTGSSNITVVQFGEWNPRIIGPCDDIRGNQYICASPQGGIYVPPPPVHASSTTLAKYYTTAQPARPTHPGTTTNCGKYYEVDAGETCQNLAFTAGISLSDFLSLNPQIEGDCINLWLGYSYCVAPVTPATPGTDGKCGPDNDNTICAGTGFGKCCSVHGFCGSSQQHCGADYCYSAERGRPIWLLSRWTMRSRP
ncbi:uncharacterized protein B0T15DRAFT_499665 [Chaetomium strumarium]|uniref:LysM domain-containing protein n=1 Tax=Chaetomium strumarium TaxID=1170767 RepID=A0AAJ0GX22_9PEZI|nr:hypothetical protein B0T15DRAFT_499665 [Chaetomium strumarium]